MSTGTKYYHKGAIAPLYIGDGTGWPASLPYIRKICVSVAIGTQSRIRLHERVPMVKIWGSSKNDQNWTTVKIVKVLFHYSSSCCCCRFRLAYLNNQTELRDETLRTDRYP